MLAHQLHADVLFHSIICFFFSVLSTSVFVDCSEDRIWERLQRLPASLPPCWIITALINTSFPLITALYHLLLNDFFWEEELTSPLKKKIIIIKCQKNFGACYNGEERMEFFFPSLCLPVFLWLFCYWGKMWRTEKQKEPREPSALYYPFVWGVWGMAAQVLPLVMKSSSIKDRTCSLLLGQRGKWLFQHFSNFNK